MNPNVRPHHLHYTANRTARHCDDSGVDELDTLEIACLVSGSEIAASFQSGAAFKANTTFYSVLIFKHRWDKIQPGLIKCPLKSFCMLSQYIFCLIIFTSLLICLQIAVMEEVVKPFT